MSKYTDKQINGSDAFWNANGATACLERREFRKQMDEWFYIAKVNACDGWSTYVAVYSSGDVDDAMDALSEVADHYVSLHVENVNAGDMWRKLKGEFLKGAANNDAYKASDVLSMMRKIEKGDKGNGQ